MTKNLNEKFKDWIEYPIELIFYEYIRNNILNLMNGSDYFCETRSARSVHRKISTDKLSDILSFTLFRIFHHHKYVQFLHWNRIKST